MQRMINAVVVLLAYAFVVSAQVDYPETIWSSVVLTRYGDRTPWISPDTQVLTPLGAQQLYSTGGSFRERYIAPPTNQLGGTLAIAGISPNDLDSNQIFTRSTVDEFIVASAQAFMQGLYPPSNNSLSNTMSVLANGDIIDFPLGGYQYSQIYTTAPLDPNSIWLDGAMNCPAFDNSSAEYFSSPEFTALQSSTKDFYGEFESSIFSGEISDLTVDYSNAYYVFDYLNYGYTHNKTINSHLSEADLFQARTLADQWEYAINGNVSASGITPGDHIRTIAGRTVAAEILGLLFINVETGGEQSKLSLLFSSFEPMISFAALAGLPSIYSDFYGIPDYGSSMVFEMYSSNPNNSGSYPDPSDLKIRFLFRNGTNSTTKLNAYPLFGRGDSSISMSLDDFATDMENIMLASVGDWCNICSSASVFCPAYTNNTYINGNGTGSTSPATCGQHGIKPVVAGVIGAIVALVVAGLFFALAMLVGGIRLYRSKAQRRSELGGFKGAEKLASDQDLTMVKGGAGATVVGTSHERVGSWELGEGSRAKDANFGSLQRPESTRIPSFEGDDVSIHHSMEPAKVDERV
ncbi:hypothetical protein MMC06_000522 [Schaereria dolodes]|nr:hypothetical protein [Schaereria dolodes]